MQDPYAFAQTNVQLYQQLARAGYSVEERVRARQAYELATLLFAGRMQPSGKDFLAHVVGTASVLAELAQPGELVAAGLIHNAYSNGDFGVIPPEARRERVRHAVGDRAEEFVHRFAVCDWSPRRIQSLDRDDIEEMGEVDRGVILIRLADLLEKHVTDPAYFVRDEHLRRLERSGTALVRLAGCLGLPTLARDLEREFEVYREGNRVIEPRIQPSEGNSFVVIPRSYRAMQVKRRIS